MPRRKRAMDPDDARFKKMTGHVRESDFAELIGGTVYNGSHIDKTDVTDAQGYGHSIKGGTWWQIFLYSRNRLETNTEFQNLGNVGNLMIRCIDALPEDWDLYQEEYEKFLAKRRLQEPMRLLMSEIRKPHIKPAFFEKAIFNGEEVDYLTVRPLYIPKDKETEFHIFAKKDVVDILSSNLDVQNSKARSRTQTDDQKVIFRLEKNVGEVELRTDRREKHRLTKFRLNSQSIFQLLTDNLPERNELTDEIICYGDAIRTFRL